MNTELDTPSLRGDGAGDLPADQTVSQPSVRRKTSPSIWGPDIIVVKCKRFRPQDDDDPLSTIVIQRPSAASGATSIANMIAKSWKMFELDQPFPAPVLTGWQATPFRAANRIASVRLRGRVIRNERPVSPWVYIDPECWNNLPLNMEFLVDGVETQLA